MNAQLEKMTYYAIRVEFHEVVEVFPMCIACHEQITSLNQPEAQKSNVVNMFFVLYLPFLQVKIITWY